MNIYRSALFFAPGSARASRAGDGALAIANFFWSGKLLDMATLKTFRRWRRKQTPETRALPGKS
jgi:hypothetical protein